MSKKNQLKILLICSAILLFSLIVILCFNLFAASEMRGSYSYIFTYCFIFIFAVYYTFALFRIESKKNKVLIFILSFLLIFWLVVEYIRFLSNGVIFPRYCYYTYFLPILFVPTILFTMNLDTFFYKKWKNIVVHILLLSISFILFLIVMFNDLHHLVFLKNGENRMLFYIIVGYSIFLCFLTFFIFIKGTFRRNRFSQYLLPLLLFCIIIFISIMFVFDFKILDNMELYKNCAFIYNILFILFFEMLMRNGLIQNNGQYTKHFNRCIIPLMIVDENNSPIFTSNLFDINNYISRKNKKKNYTIHQIPLGNNKIIYEEDLSKISELRKSLNKAIYHLKENNIVLIKRKEIDEQQAKLKIKKELYNEIETAISLKSEEINVLLSLLPENINEANKKMSIEILAMIRLRIGYLKQKCLLILQAKTKSKLSINDFKIIVDVICSDIKNAGFDSFGYVLKGNEDVLVDFALAVNEFLEYIGEMFSNKNSVALVTIHTNPTRCLIRVEVEQKVQLMQFYDEFSSFGYKIEIRQNENEYLFILKEDEKNEESL